MKYISASIVRVLLALWLLLANSAAPLFAAETQVIAIMGSSKALAYQQTIDSFKSTIKKAQSVITFSHPEATENLQTPAVVFALGSKAIRESQNKMKNSPLLATMILTDKTLKNSSNATAVLLRTSPYKQLEWLKHILPKARRVGILYDPNINQLWVDEAKVAATELNLEILAVAIKSAKELPAALKSLGRKADSILGIADKTVYSGKTAKSVLLFSFRNRIPFVGLSAAWVKAGALYALDWDYKALGHQCAAIALTLLDGAIANEIEPQFPEKSIYLLNLKTAKHMKLKLSETLIDGASKIYR